MVPEKKQINYKYPIWVPENRSAIDQLVQLETFIQNAFIKKEHLTAIFFDLEKVYATTWRYGIMKDLKSLGLKARLPQFINNFLTDRNFKTWIYNTLSDMKIQEMGVPQESILSITLFNIKINDIVKSLKPGIKGSLYMDDFLICYSSKNMNIIE